MSKRLSSYLAFLVWIMVVAIVNLYMVTAQAHDIDNSVTVNDPVVNVYPTETITIQSTSIDRNHIEAMMAMSVAGDQCHHDWSTYDIQGCAGLGWYAGENGAAFGIAKRWADTSILFSGSVQTAFDGDSAAYGAGINWRF